MTSADAYEPPPSLQARIELLRKSGREIESVVHGHSMEPTIARGTRIRIVPDRQRPAVGRAVAIVTPGGLVAHRVVGRGHLPWNRGYVLTQGDAMRLCDPPVPVALVLGEVQACQPDGDWREVGARPAMARSVTLGARLWRTLVRGAFAVHPRLAAQLVRLSLRGRVQPVRWMG